jgi:hypothetical protein
MLLIRSMTDACGFVILALVAGLDSGSPLLLPLEASNDVARVQAREVATPSAGLNRERMDIDPRRQIGNNSPEPQGGTASEPGRFQEELTLSEGRLTLHVVDRSLISILDRLTMIQTHVAILFKDRLIDRQVTANVEAAPLDVALRTLLADEDVLLLYGADEGRSILRAVLIYRKGQGDGVVADLKQSVDATSQLAHALDSPDEVERAQAVQNVIERFGTDAQEVVLRAIDDQSDHVRTVALSSALEAAFALPVDTLIRLATADPVPSVRMSAMEALASNLEAADAPQRLSAITGVAGQDPEASVRERAAGVLQQLANEPPPPENEQSPEK